MNCNKYQSDDQGDQHIEPNIREHQSHHRHDRENDQDRSIIDRAAEDHDGIVSKEVEEEPEDEDGEEYDHRYRMVEEAQEDDQEDDEGVVDAEVVEIAAEPDGCLAVGEGAGEGGGIEELAPRAAGRD